MTTSARLERDLPTILSELAMGPEPDYVDDVFGRTGRMRQRAAWTFPERWFSMAEFATRPVFVPRLPLRAIGVALVLLALLVAGVVVGSQQTKVPPPFGLARNGIVTYSANGDIFTLDPATETVRAIASGPELDRWPMFSPDGTRIVFFRQVGQAETFDLVVVAPDGSAPRVITTEPLKPDGSIDWSADSRSVILDKSGGQVFRLDAGKAGPPEVLKFPDIYMQGSVAFQPPNGDRILYRAITTEGTGLWVMGADGSDVHPLFQLDRAAARENDLVEYTWSPDGTMIAFTQTPADRPDAMRIFVMRADGTGVRPLTHQQDGWSEGFPVWSPDGKHIAFNRWQEVPGQAGWAGRPIGIASVDDGSVMDAGPTSVDNNGFVFDYSPDGKTILSVSAAVDPFGRTQAPVSIDATDGTSRVLNWAFGSGPHWQRLAP